MLQVKNFDHTIAIAAFTNDLWDKDFIKFLIKKMPKVFFNLLLREEKYINAKEVMALKYQGYDKTAKKEKEEKYHSRRRSLRRDHQLRKKSLNLRTYPSVHAIEAFKKRVSHHHGKEEPSNSSSTNEKWHNQKR